MASSSTKPYREVMNDSQLTDLERTSRAHRTPSASRNVTRLFVDRDEFCRLLLSRQSLKRADDGAADLACLVEDATGQAYAIQREHLFRVG